MKKNDELSQLPDEVLVTILSLLTMKEAARTSVLSRRWCKLWTSYPNLNFDAVDVLRSLVSLDATLRIKAKQEYINWVNSVLNSYQGTTVHEFHVRFDLNAEYSHDIDSWVKFAFEKKVESLTMHFARLVDTVRQQNHYTFPALGSSLLQFPHYIISLRKLDLKYVDISEDFIQHCISSCPRLEELAIIGSNSHNLVHFNIDGPSLCLKHLKIAKCSYAKSIYLSASNLSSFEYDGGEIDINYANIPNLVDVSLGGVGYFKYIIFNFPRLSDYVTRLEKLTLRLRGRGFQENMAEVEYPELPYLRNLKLDVYAFDEDSILCFASLIKAAPSLHKFELELFWVASTCYCTSVCWCVREVEKISKCPHQCLKEVEIIGFLGETIDMELAMYVLENAVALERVTLNLQLPCEKTRGEDVPLKRQELAMKQALRLKSEFSLGEKLSIV